MWPPYPDDYYVPPLPDGGFTVYTCPCGNWTVEHPEPAEPFMLKAVEDLMYEHADECRKLAAAVAAKGLAL